MTPMSLTRPATARAVRAPGEAEAKDLVAQLVIEHDEVVSLDDVANKADAEADLEQLLVSAQDPRAVPGVVVDDLLHHLPVTAFAAAGDGAGESGDIGWDVFESRHRRLPGAIAADDDPLWCDRGARIDETPLRKLLLGEVRSVIIVASWKLKWK
ncbi:hypothetical protein PG994_001833 [Apiospora phragmitis]|uniref:Uncharacterized protein n=1 Tax=Apiospora phragmitis TaxID=2905665 RepID=A0ABR1WUJ5_9PEZI